jgi:MFS family permease
MKSPTSPKGDGTWERLPRPSPRRRRPNDGASGSAESARLLSPVRGKPTEASAAAVVGPGGGTSSSSSSSTAAAAAAAASAAGGGRLACRFTWGSASFRFTMLFLSLTVLMSGYFSYDLPGITSADLKRELHLNNAQLGALFSVYALPNAFMPLFSGALFTRVGVWRGVLAISGLITLGIAVVAAGIAAKSYGLLLLGRALYGLGGESIYVGIDVLVTGWFKEAELGLAYGLVQAGGQAGSFAAFYGVPALTVTLGGHQPIYYIGAVVAAVAFVALLIAKTLEDRSVEPEDAGEGEDDRSSRLEDEGEEEEEEEVGEGEDDGEYVARSERVPSPRRRRGLNVDADAEEESAAGGGDDGDESAARPLVSGGSGSAQASASSSSSSSTLLLRVPDRSEGAHDDQIDGTDDDDDDDDDGGSRAGRVRPRSPARGGVVTRLLCRIASSPVGEALGLDHLLGLSLDFWLLFFCIVAYSSVFYTFLAFGNDYLQATYGMDSAHSGRVVGLVSISSCVLSPTSGLLLDKFGGRPVASFLSMVLACISFALMGFTHAPVVPAVAAAGFAYSVLPSALYPMVAEVVPDESFTVVYAAVNAGVNLLLTVTVYLAGWLSHATAKRHGEGAAAPSAAAVAAAAAAVAAANYTYVFVMFVLLTFLGVLASGKLMLLRRKESELVAAVAAARRARDLDEEEEEQEEEDGNGEERKKDGDRVRFAPILRLEPVPRRGATLNAPVVPPPHSGEATTQFQSAAAAAARSLGPARGRRGAARRDAGAAAAGPEAASMHAAADIARTSLRPAGVRARSAGPAAGRRGAAAGAGGQDMVGFLTGPAAAAAAAAGLQGPIFVRNDGRLYSAMGLAQRMGHNVPMQVMDARRRGGFTRPQQLGFPVPFQAGLARGGEGEGGMGSRGLGLSLPLDRDQAATRALLRLRPHAARGAGAGAGSSQAGEVQSSAVLPAEELLSRSYAGPFFLEQLLQGGRGRRRAHLHAGREGEGVAQPGRRAQVLVARATAAAGELAVDVGLAAVPDGDYAALPSRSPPLAASAPARTAFPFPSAEEEGEGGEEGEEGVAVVVGAAALSPRSSTTTATTNGGGHRLRSNSWGTA